MKAAEPSFGVTDFLNGAKSAYEMILMAFERGDLSEVRAFLAEPVAEAFQSVIDARAANGQTVTAQYVGTRETALAGAEYDRDTGMAEISVRFVGELIASTRDADGNVIEGDPKAPRKQRDIWTFARRMGQDDPNWQLVATNCQFGSSWPIRRAKVQMSRCLRGALGSPSMTLPSASRVEAISSPTNRTEISAMPVSRSYSAPARAVSRVPTYWAVTVWPLAARASMTDWNASATGSARNARTSDRSPRSKAIRIIS